MVAVVRQIVHANERSLAAHFLVDLAPEVTSIGLGLRDGAPVVVNVLVLTSDLAVVATVSFVQIVYENLHCPIPSQSLFAVDDPGTDL